MFICETIEQVNHEQYHDRLRRLEREQRIRQVEVAKGMPGLWQWADGVVLSVIHRIKSVGDSKQAGPPSHLTGKTA